jgi:antitoxin VapB
MAFHVRDPETDSLVRELALKRGVGLTEAIKLAATEALQREAQDRARRLERMRAIVDEIATWPKTGLKADKAFFDDLSGDGDEA